MLKKQKTIKEQIVINGVGLHKGSNIQMILKPALANEGITFIRVDLSKHPLIKVIPGNIIHNIKEPRCTVLGQDKILIHTVEHLMSALCGLEINNLIIEINGDEIPGLDGSALEFVKAIEKIGVVEQEAQALNFRIQEPIGVCSNDASVWVFPSPEFKVSYAMHYQHFFLRSQFFSAVINKNIFRSEIAPCRTFCLEAEADELRRRGLGKGATYQNTLVVGKDGIKDNELRFEDEFARHKALDLIGDLYLLGRPILGHVFAVKSGHTLNIELVKKIFAQQEHYEKRGFIVGYEIGDQKELDINEVMKILPHRYPFLLVDRVIELDRGKKGIGIKNVTINDPFFQGHFPTKPLMPGVLILEAMAQTGGAIILTKEVHYGKIALFWAVDNVKFRRSVVPGDQLVMEVDVLKDKTKVVQIHGQAKVNGQIVAEADMIFSFVEASYLN